MSFPTQFLEQQLRQIRVVDVHDIRHIFNDLCIHSSQSHGFQQFKAFVPAAKNHCALRCSFLQIFSDGIGVFQCIQRKNTLHAGKDVQMIASGSDSNDQFIVFQLVFIFIGKIPDLHRFVLKIHINGFTEESQINSISQNPFLVPRNKLLLFLYEPFNVIRKSAGSIGDVFSFFKHGDFRAGNIFLYAVCSTQSSCNCSDDYHFHFQSHPFVINKLTFQYLLVSILT